MNENLDLKISLAAARINRNLTQKQAAQLLGINKQTLINWEHGKTSPTVAKMKELCEIYNTPIDFIFLPPSLPKVDKNKSAASEVS